MGLSVTKMVSVTVLLLLHNLPSFLARAKCHCWAPTAFLRHCSDAQFLLLWAFRGKCSECGSGTDSSCAGSFCGMLLLCTWATKLTQTFAVWMKCEPTNYCSVENMPASLGLPGSQEGTEQVLWLLKLNQEKMSISYPLMMNWLIRN